MVAQLIVLQFRAAGAVSARTARSFHPWSIVDEVEFLRLLRTGIIREPKPGRYFLDERAPSNVLPNKPVPVLVDP